MFIGRQIKALKIFSLKTWCTKKPFGYRVAHHGYLLTSCPGQALTEQALTGQALTERSDNGTTDMF